MFEQSDRLSYDKVKRKVCILAVHFFHSTSNLIILKQIKNLTKTIAPYDTDNKQNTA